MPASPSGDRVLQIFGWGASLLVAAVVVTGLIVAGSPGRARVQKADEQRVTALLDISRAIESYYNQEGKLPEYLAVVRKQPYVFVASWNDPKTGEEYEYRTLAATKYELCAVFETVSSPENRPRRPPYGSQPSEFWSHTAGRKCFRFEVKPKQKGRGMSALPS